MPHQCVKCSALYQDGADELLKGCPCKGKLFFYIRKEKFEKARKQLTELSLSMDQRTQIETDVREIVGSDLEPDLPVVLDLEAVRVVKPGSYELDLVSLFNKAPIVVKIGDGKYIIDLAQTFKRFKDGKSI